MRFFLSFVTVIFILLFAPYNYGLAQEIPPDKLPEKVVFGAYINDIQKIDLSSHSYNIDFYIWFRWRNRELNPDQTFEFMNKFDPEGHVQNNFYKTPVPQPDGSIYKLIRHQGEFSSKFDLSNYPFDKQTLKILIEDQEMGARDFIYVPDKNPITFNPELKLPGFKINKINFTIKDKSYPTTFGDLSAPNIEAYSQIGININLERPFTPVIVKQILPLFIVVTSALLALLLNIKHTQARIGLAITSLLALVALQLSTVNSLPNVDYLTLIDQLYVLSYLQVLFVVCYVVQLSRLNAFKETIQQNALIDKIIELEPYFVPALILLYIFSTSAIIIYNT